MAFFNRPLPPPEKYDPDGMWANPGHTNPLPNPTLYPVGEWHQTRVPLEWSAATIENATRQATWSSPLFDLRPDIRAAQGEPPIAQSIWRAAGIGAGGRLWIMVNFGTATDPLDLIIQSQEFAHPFVSAAGRVPAITGRQDVTKDFVTGLGQQAGLGAFYAPGDGYPIRYWRLQLFFGVQSAKADPSITIEAAYY